MNSLPLLSLLLVLPVATAAGIWLLPERAARAATLAAAFAGLMLALAVLAAFDSARPGFQLVEQALWIPSLNVHYRVGIDGLSVLFLPAMHLLFVGVVVFAGRVERARLHCSLLLLLHAATLGIFVALDGILFFLCWELTLVPLHFLNALWGLGPQRRQAATQYTLTMLAGGVPLLFAFVMLAFASVHDGGSASFDLRDWLALPLGHDAQLAVFLLLLAGFAVKLPAFPLHTWLPSLAAEGPVGVLALVTGLKLGAWGLIRYAIPLAPDVVRELHWLLAGLGVVGILYGAAAALAQTNLRSMLAYSSLSHVGLVLLGIASLNLAGIQGALLQLLNFTLASGGLFLLAGALHRRLGSTELAQLGGVAKSLPLLSSAFLLLGLAGMGLPGTSGFPAEFLILLSAFKTHGGAALAALAGMVVGAAYFLGAWRRAFLGPLARPALAETADLRASELWFVAVVGLVVVLVGMYPEPVLRLIDGAAQTWALRVG
jgi:NADH-quinone oxidoreductase subunit M